MKISKLDNKGRGITYQNNKITFVENALEDEDVVISVINDKAKYAEAKAINISNENVNRVVPKCPFYEVCGGCNLMHMNYAYQEEYKLNKVKDILKKYGSVNEDIRLVKNDQELFYRNKVTLKIENGKFGYYNANTHEFRCIDSCLLASASINKVIKKHDFIKVNEGEIVIRSNNRNQVLIAIRTDFEYEIGNIPSYVKGIVINNKTIFNNNYFFDDIGDLTFKVSYNAFFQVNNFMAKQIFDILNQYLKGKNLLDLYCGVGTLGLSLKDKYERIYGIEVIPNAIKDAIYNAKTNNIVNAHYYTGDTGTILKKINVKFDTIIVDPPRSGLNKETLEHIIRIRPKSLAYVSCDPMTLARDLKELCKYYDIIKLNALDMFPNTYHVECVCIMNLR